MNYSRFGSKFTAKSGIVELMDDLGSALNENPDMLFMGGGNPGRIPEVEVYFEKKLQYIAQTPEARHSLLGVYQSPQGEKHFREQLANYLVEQFGWPLSDKNIAIANGSQSAFFLIYNMLAGDMPNGERKKIHFPLAPEYIGYADAGLSNDFFSSTQPSIEIIDPHTFKYHVDFSKLTIDDNIAALSVSRPTNPTGNVITDKEIQHLDQLAKQANIPLIIDGAYGLPFPNIIFAEATPHWNSNTVLVLSLSKLGLPGIRTGIVIANEAFIQDFTNANIITNLACGNLGPALSKELFTPYDKTPHNIVKSRNVEGDNIEGDNIKNNGIEGNNVENMNNDATSDIQKLTNLVTPFYQQKATHAVNLLKQKLNGIPFKIHKPEGAIFLWLWFEGLPITSKELYQRLKNKGVLIIPGEDFFIGIDEKWQHKYECIRLSYAQDVEVVERAINVIAVELKAVFNL
jgi:valine--pyruvate aminotransferase